MVKRLVCGVLLLVVSFVLGLEFPGTCESNNITSVENFNATQFSGSWYIIKRYNNTLEEDTCNATAFVTVPSDGISNEFNVSLFSEKSANLTGTAKPQNVTINETKFDITFNNNASDEYSLVVTNTDYTSYSVVWLCKNFTNEKSSQIVWVFSRNKSDGFNATLIPEGLNRTLLIGDDEETCKSAVDSGSTTFVLSRLVIALYIVSFSSFV